MSEIKDGGAAFPLASMDHVADGMTLRQFAAIRLRVPNSGTDWLDEMIREAQRVEMAGRVLNGMLAGGFADTEPYNEGGKEAVFHADIYAARLLSARTQEGE